MKLFTKSSKMTADMEFKPVDSELKFPDVLGKLKRMKLRQNQRNVNIATHLNAALKTPETKSPGKPGKSPNNRITSKGSS